MSLQQNRKVSFSDINKSLSVTNGNTGIGTTAPSHTLDVNGGLRSTNFTTSNALITNVTTTTLNVRSIISVSDTANAPAGAVTGTNVQFTSGGMNYLHQNPPDEYNPSGSTESRPYNYSSSYFVTALTVDPNPDPNYSPYSYFYNPTAFKYTGTSSASINWRVQTPGASAPMFGTYTIYIDILDTDGTTIKSTPASLVYSSGSVDTDTGVKTTTLNPNEYIRFRGDGGMGPSIDNFVFTYDFSATVNGLIANSSGITTGTLKATDVTSASAQFTNVSSTTGTVGTLINTNSVSTNISSATLNLSSGITAASAQIANSNITTQTVGTSRITTSLIAIGNSNTVGSIYTTGGNVGVNTIAPLTRFNVVGNSTGTNGTVLITGGDEWGHGLHVASQNSLQRLGFNNNGTIGNIFAFNYSSLTSQNLILQYPGGNVGICTTVPSHTLDVNGGLRSTNFTTTNALITNVTTATLNVSTGVTTATAQISNLRVSSIISVSETTANPPAEVFGGRKVEFISGGLSYYHQLPPDEYNPSGGYETRPYYYSSSYFVTALPVDPTPGNYPYSSFYNPTAFKYTGSSSAVVNWRVQTPGASAPMFGTYTIYIDILDTDGTTIISTPATLVYSSESVDTDTGVKTTTLNQNQYIRFRGVGGMGPTIEDFIFTYDLSTNESGLIANSSGITTGSLNATSINCGNINGPIFTTQNTQSTLNRSFDTVYQNTTGKSMFVSVTANVGTMFETITCITDSNSTPTTSVVGGAIYSHSGSFSFVVLSGNYYKVTRSANASITCWTEWS